MSAETPAGYTVEDLARRWRVGADKIRRWIVSGQLAALNTASTLCGRPRYVVTPESVAAFEQRRTSAPPPKPPRRPKRTALVDYYPD